MLSMARLRYVMYFVLGFVVAMIVTIAPRADALFEKYHASACEISSGAVINGNGDVSPTSGTGAASLWCAYPDSDRLRPQAINAVFVDVYDNSSTYAVSASACVKYYNAVGGACGPSYSTNGTPGITNLQLNRSGTVELSQWTSSTAGHYAYVTVNMQSSSTGVFGMIFQE